MKSYISSKQAVLIGVVAAAVAYLFNQNQQLFPSSFTTSSSSSQHVIIEPLNPTAPLRLPDGVKRRVLVAGAGLAGMSAALELAERGYEVVIREASDVIGGRLCTRNVPIFTPSQKNGSDEEALNDDDNEFATFAIEHGFHAWFENYWQFKDIRQRLGINHFFKPWHAVRFLYKNPQYQPESIESIGPYPFNLIWIVLKSRNLSLWDAIMSTLSVFDMVWFNHDDIWAKYDNITFHEWAQSKHVSRKFYDVIMAPSLSVTVNERQVLSAAEMLMYQHMYFLSHPSADRREVTTEDYYTAVLGPWEQRLRILGVEFELNTPVTGLTYEHVNGTISVYDKDSDDRFDHVVLATNLHGVKSILKGSSSNVVEERYGLSTLRDRVAHLEIAPPYKVFRGFFDKQLEGSEANEMVIETPDIYPVNLVAQYHLLEDESAKWANKTGGSVLEFHLYTWQGGNITDDEVWPYIKPTVCEYILPEVCERDFKLLGGYVQSNEDFPSFRAGLHTHRPAADTAQKLGVERLALAGDWLQTSYPSALMERAVSTGREAANLILLQDNVRQVSLTVTSSKGPGLQILPQE